MDNKKQFILNLIASLVTFVFNLGIGFLLTPYIVRTVGAEAYGFVGLANNMVNYATLVTVALNSVSSRFITVAYHNGEKDKANRYFTSTLTSDAIIVLVLTVISVPLILNLERVINISPHLVEDVKALFSFLFINFFVTTISTVFTVATFIRNKLYLTSLANLVCILLKVGSMLVLFSAFPTHVFYIGVATLLSTIVLAIMNYAYTCRLIPDIRFSRDGFSLASLKHMLSAGVWSSVSKLQSILQDGLSLLLTNLLVSPYLMGVLSVSQTIPTYLSGFMTTISGLFSPNRTKLFAQGRREELVAEIKSSMRITGFFANTIAVVLVILGYEFIHLWQPNQDTELIYGLMMVTMSAYLVSGVASTLQSVPLLVNRMKTSALLWLCCGVLSLTLTLIALRFGDGGVYAVAFIPQLLGIVANVTFVPLLASSYLQMSRRSLYWIYLQYVMASGIACAVAWLCKRFLLGFASQSWLGFLVSCAIVAVIVMLVDYVVLLGHRERTMIVMMIRRLLRQSDRR